MTELTQALLHELLLYDPYEGTLTWRHRHRRWFKTDADYKTWNKRFAGKPAFSSLDSDGYLMGRIFGKAYRAHRVIWLYTTGGWPNPEVDHDNHCRSDNRWQNLFEVTLQKQNQNQRLRSDNSSGRVGVRWYNKKGKWRAEIKVAGQSRYLGYFSDFEEAVAARRKAESQYGFSAGHGRRTFGIFRS